MINNAHGFDIRSAEQFDEANQLVAAARVVGIEPHRELHPIDAHQRQQPAQILKPQWLVGIWQRPAEFALLGRRQRWHDGQPHVALTELALGIVLTVSGVRAEHLHVDAIESIIGNFGLPFFRALVSIGRFARGVLQLGRLLLVVDDQPPVELEVGCISFAVERIEELEADFGIALADAGQLAMDNDFVERGVDIARVLRRHGNSRQPSQPHVGDGHATVQIAFASADGYEVDHHSIDLGVSRL